MRSFKDIGFATEVISYSTPAMDAARISAGLGEIGRKACHYPGLIFFARHSEDFESMLGGVDEVCNSDLPAILGDDDVARLAADMERRRNGRAGRRAVVAGQHGSGSPVTHPVQDGTGLRVRRTGGFDN
ncbi:hypothetical protein [Streptosporangium saharense]|uniref:hypothetical protein n=1 Tax=Streptosporangium saharense TaxID=1706840 RepID=UPI00332586E4